MFLIYYDADFDSYLPSKGRPLRLKHLIISWWPSFRLLSNDCPLTFSLLTAILFHISLWVCDDIFPVYAKVPVIK